MSMEHKRDAQSGSEKLMRYGMWTCCAVMLLPILAYLAAGEASSMTESLLTFSPLLLCVGAHLVMHRLMGKTSHEKAPEARAIARIDAE